MSNEPENKQDNLKKDDTNKEDPVIKMFKNIGCIEEHYAVKKCMDETKNPFSFLSSRSESVDKSWEQCKPEVTKVFQCFAKHEKSLHLNFYKGYFWE